MVLVPVPSDANTCAVLPVYAPMLVTTLTESIITSSSPARQEQSSASTAPTREALRGAGHGVHACAPTSGLYVPASQSWHGGTALSTLVVPGPQELTQVPSGSVGPPSLAGS